MTYDPRETDRVPAENGGKCPECGTIRESRRYHDDRQGQPPVFVIIDCPGCGAQTRLP